MKFNSVWNLITHITRTYAYHAREKKNHSFQHISMQETGPCSNSTTVKVCKEMKLSECKLSR